MCEIRSGSRLFYTNDSATMTLKSKKKIIDRNRFKKKKMILTNNRMFTLYMFYDLRHKVQTFFFLFLTKFI